MEKINYNSEDIIDHQGVSAIIKNERGEILMQKHIKYGFWTIPVGKVNLGENIEEGLKEEILEECNLNVEDLKEIANKKIVYIRGGNKVTVDSHLFEVIKYSGIMRNNEPDKHEFQKFISLNEIKKLPYLSDMTLLYLDILGFKRDKRIRFEE